LCIVAYVTLEKKDKLSLNINTDLLDKKPMLKKKLKNNLNSKDSDIGFSDNISKKQMTINMYNILIKMFAK
jgi:hypothetical protein